MYNDLSGSSASVASNMFFTSIRATTFGMTQLNKVIVKAYQETEKIKYSGEQTLHNFNKSRENSTVQELKITNDRELNEIRQKLIHSGIDFHFEMDKTDNSYKVHYRQKDHDLIFNYLKDNINYEKSMQDMTNSRDATLIQEISLSNPKQLEEIKLVLQQRGIEFHIGENPYKSELASDNEYRYNIFYHSKDMDVVKNTIEEHLVGEKSLKEILQSKDTVDVASINLKDNSKIMALRNGLLKVGVDFNITEDKNITACNENGEPLRTFNVYFKAKDAATLNTALKSYALLPSIENKIKNAKEKAETINKAHSKEKQKDQNKEQFGNQIKKQNLEK